MRHERRDGASLADKQDGDEGQLPVPLQQDERPEEVVGGKHAQRPFASADPAAGKPDD